MFTNRRDLLKLGASALALAATPASAPNQTPARPPKNPTPFGPAQPSPADAGRSDGDDASTYERELQIVNFELLEAEAQKIISPRRYSFIGPAGAGIAYRQNLRAFEDAAIMPRRLRSLDLGDIDMRVRLLGHDLALPIITCPMGSHARFHARGELASAAGTGKGGSLYVSSGAANNTLEDIAAATQGPKWFQIYMNRDMEINRWLVERAKAAGFTAIVLTADGVGPNMSDEFVRLGAYWPPGLTLANHDPARGGRGTYRDYRLNIGFEDIGWLHQASGLPVIVKGLMHPDDVKRSIGAGASAVWISNHGGRQLDGVLPALKALPAAAKAAGKVPVIFDSGIRRGVDVFKALALGATVVGIGRPVLWSLINGGSAGVASAYAFMEHELREAMFLAGAAKLSAITREHIVWQNG